MEIKVKHNQTIQDVAMMYTGSSEHFVDILLANNKPDATLRVGEQLTIPDALVNRRFVEFYKQQDVVVACSPVELEVEDYEPPTPSPNSDVTIRVNGTFVKTVNAPHTADIPLLDVNEDRVPISVNQGVVTVPNSTVQLKNTANDLQQTIPAPPGSVVIVESPDVNIFIKDYQGSLIAEENVPSGRSHEVRYPNTNINISANGQFLKTAQAPNDTDIAVTDENGDPADFSVNDGGIVIRSSFNTLLGRFPDKTGTIEDEVYYPGDDADTRRGEYPFFLSDIDLSAVNYFGNRARFTGVTGSYWDADTDSKYRDRDGNLIIATPGQYDQEYMDRDEAFPFRLLIDWSTLRSDGRFMMYSLGDEESSGLGWIWDNVNSALNPTEAIEVNGLRGWSLINSKEMYHSFSFNRDFPPLGLRASSSQLSYLTSNYCIHNGLSVTGIEDENNTNRDRCIYTRITHISELDIFQ